MCAGSERDREKVRGGGDYYEAVELSSSVKGLQNILMSRVETAAEKSFRSYPLSLPRFLSPSLSSFFLISLPVCLPISFPLSFSLDFSFLVSQNLCLLSLCQMTSSREVRHTWSHYQIYTSVTSVRTAVRIGHSRSPARLLT